MTKRQRVGVSTVVFIGAVALAGAVAVPGASAAGRPDGAGKPTKPPKPGASLTCGSTITKNVRLRAHLDCTGQSGTAVLVVGADHVKIDLNGFSIRNTRGFTHAVHIEGREHVEVRNGSIEGGTEYGIVVKTSSKVHLKRLTVSGAGVPASDFGAAVEVDTANDVKVDRVTVQGNNADGMHLHAATKVRIHHSVFRANGGDGLWINQNTTGLRIDHSEFTGSLVDDGFDAIDAGTIDIRHSVFSGNPGRGIELDRIASLRLHHVTLASNGGEGLMVDTIAKMRLDHVAATSNGADGIHVNNNTGAAKNHRIHHTASTSNTGDGFDVQFPVIGKHNRASGNTGTNTTP